MAGPFTCIEILSCNISYDGVHGDLLVVWCVPINCSGTVRGGGFPLGVWSGFQEEKFRQGNVG